MKTPPAVPLVGFDSVVSTVWLLVEGPPDLSSPASFTGTQSILPCTGLSSTTEKFHRRSNLSVARCTLCSTRPRNSWTCLSPGLSKSVLCAPEPRDGFAPPAILRIPRPRVPRCELPTPRTRLLWGCGRSSSGRGSRERLLRFFERRRGRTPTTLCVRACDQACDPPRAARPFKFPAPQGCVRMSTTRTRLGTSTSRPCAGGPPSRRASGRLPPLVTSWSSLWPRALLLAYDVSATKVLRDGAAGRQQHRGGGRKAVLFFGCSGQTLSTGENNSGK